MKLHYLDTLKKAGTRSSARILFYHLNSNKFGSCFGAKTTHFDVIMMKKMSF